VILLAKWTAPDNLNFFTGFLSSFKRIPGQRTTLTDYFESLKVLRLFGTYQLRDQQLTHRKREVSNLSTESDVVNSFSIFWKVIR